MRDDWQSVTALPPLERDELQLWRVRLGEVPGEGDLFKSHLSAAELERAERMRAGQVRLQFVVARACLRVLLGNLLGLVPARVPIVLSAYGKPETPERDGHRLFFNVAHSRDTILIALSRDGGVGIDVENLDRAADLLGVARKAFTVSEFQQIESVQDPHGRRPAFFRCWTRKEAVLKADGRGLSLPMDSFTVPVIERAASTPVVVQESGTEDRPTYRPTWFVTDIALGEEVAGAFAVGRPQCAARSFQFPLDLV